MNCADRAGEIRYLFSTRLSVRVGVATVRLGVFTAQLLLSRTSATGNLAARKLFGGTRRDRQLLGFADTCTEPQGLVVVVTGRGPRCEHALTADANAVRQLARRHRDGLRQRLDRE